MIVVVCAVFITRGDALLLVKEHKDAAKDKLGLPGGKLEEGETLEACAVRECLEETGLHVRLKNLLMVSQKPHTHEGNTVIKFVYGAEIIGQEATAEMQYDYYDQATFDSHAAEAIRGKDVVWLASRYFDNPAMPGVPHIRVFV